MRRTIIMAVALWSLVATPAQAQEQEFVPCGPGGMVWSGLSSLSTTARDQIRPTLNEACGLTAGFMNALQPAMGMSFSGGNPMLGSANTLGVKLDLLPRVSLTVRANAATMPDEMGLMSGIADSYAGALPVTLPGGVFAGAQADLSLGLANGASFGLGALDFIGSFGYLPLSKMDLSALGMEMTDVLSYGAGARIGILRQGFFMPGLSVSGMYRRTQGFDLQSELAIGGTSSKVGLASELTNYSARAILSKGILFIDFAVGAGYDQYTGTYGIDIETAKTLNGESYTFRGSLEEAPHSSAAWNAFANVGLQLFVLHIVAEAGFQRPMDVITLDDLKDPAAFVSGMTLPEGGAAELFWGSNYFGSVGLRLEL